MTVPMTPDDVYRSVNELKEAIWQLKMIAYFVTALIVSMMALKVWETARIARLLRRVESHLETAAAHGRITDGQRNRVDETLNRTVEVLKAAVGVLQRLGVTVQRIDPADQLNATAARVTEEIRQVPAKTAELVSRRMDLDYSNDSNTVHKPHDSPPKG